MWENTRKCGMINYKKSGGNMIKVTDGYNVIMLNDKDLGEYNKFYKGLVIKSFFDYWLIELVIIKEGNISEIIKVYNGGDEILDSFKNKKVSADEVLLSKRDFKRFKKIYYRMKSRKDYRREAIIEAYSILLSYEYYQASVLEDCRDVTREEIFRDLCGGYEYKMYHDVIIARSKEILKEKYKIE